MSKRVILAIAGLMFLAGCGNSGSKSAGIPLQPKWKGAPYRIAFDTKAGKPDATGLNIPQVKYTANPDALETRVVLVVRFDVPAAAEKGQPIANRIIGTPVDIHGADGVIPADYMERASKGLSTYLGGYCVQGKVNVSVAIARSSLNPTAGDAEVDAKRLSDWLPTELTAKKTHGKC